MKSTKQQSDGTVENITNTAAAREGKPRTDGSDSTSGEIRTTARDYANPVDYPHPYESMKRLAEALALGFDCNRTRHAYYRQMRLVHEHFGCDPEQITEEQLRDAKRRGPGEPSPDEPRRIKTIERRESEGSRVAPRTSVLWTWKQCIERGS